jgi:hypothetical protein
VPSFCSPTTGTVITWTGDAGTNDWNTAANWSPEAVPDPLGTGSYSSNYACIGEDDKGNPAKVTLSSAAQYVAGIDVGQGAQLTVAPTSSLYVGSNEPNNLANSFVRHGAQLTVDAGTLGGNGALFVGGGLDLLGHLIGGTGHVAKQVGTGLTTIYSAGTMLVDGVTWGKSEIGPHRSIQNYGTIRFVRKGYLDLDDGSSLTDAPHSRLVLDGNGGIYPTTPGSATGGPAFTQAGAITESGPGNSIVSVPVRFSTGVTVSDRHGALLLNANSLPSASVGRGAGYGIGTCEQQKNQVCHDVEATTWTPQSALVTTSSQAPPTSTIRVRLPGTNPAKVGGRRLIGKRIVVTAPTGRTTHSTHLTLTYDASLRGVRRGLRPHVFRNGHRITYCAQHPLRATNPSCVASVKTFGSSSTLPLRGDLQVFVITIKPRATWAVTT